jgi:hypothetical protein
MSPFIGLLFACSHVEHFRFMQAEHGVAPESDHYACTVNLLDVARRGQGGSDRPAQSEQDECARRV